MNRVLRGLIVAVSLLVLANASAYAQTAQISGTVKDTSGAVLPGASVTATQTDTGFKREAVTDANGLYTLVSLPIGPYRLEAALAGFKTFSETGIVLQVNSNPIIPVVLALGQME